MIILRTHTGWILTATKIGFWQQRWLDFDNTYVDFENADVDFMLVNPQKKRGKYIGIAIGTEVDV